MAFCKVPAKPIEQPQLCSFKKSQVKESAAAAACSIVLASIVTIFSKLLQFFSSTNTQKHRSQILKKDPAEHQHCPSLIAGNRPRLPPNASPEKRTIFLDLDETLVHTQHETQPENYDFVVRPVIGTKRVSFFVLKRPHVNEFLEALSQKFEIVVFTAAVEAYASGVLDRLDRGAVISHRLYRDSCKEIQGKFVKDLSDLGRDLRSVVIVDDNPNSYALQPENGIPIRPFVGDPSDGELKRLVEFFEDFDCSEDMRDVVKRYLAREAKRLELESAPRLKKEQ